MPLWYHRIDDYKWIHGSIRQDLQPDERSVWSDFLALAGLTREPRRGFIERSKGIPYPKNVLTCMLNITEELFDRTVTKCVKEGRLKVFKDGTMYLANWERYNEVESWHKKKQKEADKANAKNISVDKAKKSRSKLENAAKGLESTVNKLSYETRELNKTIKEDNTHVK
jgi:hypothetical protein